MLLSSIVLFVSSFLLCFYIVPVLIKVANKFNLYDHPTEIKRHGRKVPYLGGVAILVLATGSWQHIDLAPVPWYAFAGGVLGLAVVAASNVVIPRIPVLYTTLLLFLGQLTAGVAIDFALGRNPDGWQISGAGLVMTGLVLSLFLDRQAVEIEGNKVTECA